jgi:hypothetical protein
LFLVGEGSELVQVVLLMVVQVPFIELPLLTQLFTVQLSDPVGVPVTVLVHEPICGWLIVYRLPEPQPELEHE